MRTGGPLGWPTEVGRRRTRWLRTEPVIETLGPAYDGFAARGYDGMVTMGTLEELLTGRPFASLEDDPRWGAPVSEVDEPDDSGAIALTQTLRDALAAAGVDTLRSVASQWARTEELAPFDGAPPTPEDVAQHRHTLTRLRALAQRATSADQQLYWYFRI